MTGYALQRKKLDWPVVLFILGYHLGLLVILPLYFTHRTPGLGVWLSAAVLLLLTSIGIGGAYHRFYAHRCFELSKPVEVVFLLLGTLAVQGSILQWASDHRRHHAFVDTDDDPYSIRKGFWYAHMLWMFEKGRPIDERRVADLLRNPMLRFQHRYYGWLAIGGNALVWLLLGTLLGDYLGTFVLVWWARLFLSHHLTWFINSLAHTWGERTFSKEHSAVDNYVLAILTVGEGYHNYHHTFASDYRNGHRWYHFDPVKWTVWGLSKLGLAWNLKRYNEFTIRGRLLSEDRRLLLAALRRRFVSGRADLEQRVEGLAGLLQEQLVRMGRLADELRRLKREGAAEAKRLAARLELRRAKQEFRRHWRSWTRLCDRILDDQPLPGTA